MIANDVAVCGHQIRWLKVGESLPVQSKQVQTRQVTFKNMLLSNKYLTPGVVIKRNIPFRFDEGKRFSEDYLLWLTILARGYRGDFICVDLGYMYKAPFGAGGLSSKLWDMEKGELDTYFRLYREGHVSLLGLGGVCFLSILKYLRRSYRVNSGGVSA